MGVSGAGLSLARIRAARSAHVVLTATVAFAALAAPARASRMGDPGMAAVQVALRAAGLYSGTVDGIAGSGTRSAVRRVQRRAGLLADGIAGPQTLRAL